MRHHHESPDGAAPRLTDEEIRAIALRIQRAVTGQAIGDPVEDIFARRHELPPEDEDRVEAALVALGAADPEDTTRAEREAGADGPERPTDGAAGQPGAD